MAKAVVAFLVLLLAVFGEFRLSQAERKPVKFYQLKKDDFTVKLTNWGATVVSVILPDSKGKLADVALGFDTLASYINDTTYFGAIVGRVANRIGGASFSLNGKKYKIVPNEGKNTLHGGHRGFSKVIFTVTEQQGGEFPSIRFTYHSFDGEQGAIMFNFRRNMLCLKCNWRRPHACNSIKVPDQYRQKDQHFHLLQSTQFVRDSGDRRKTLKKDLDFLSENDSEHNDLQWLV